MTAQTILGNVIVQHRFGTAVTAIIVAILLFDIQGVMIKLLGADYSVPQLSLFRNLFGLLPSVVALYLTAEWHQQGKSWRLANWRLGLARGVLIAGAQLSFYKALVNMELATATTLAFSGPLFITSLSVPLLGHKIGLWRTLAVVLGFAGVVMVMQPGGDTLNRYTFFAVSAAFFYALVSLSSRFFDRSVPTALISFYTTAMAAFLMGVVLLATDLWISVPFGIDWLWLMVMGLAGGCAVLLLIMAYRLADPSSLSPFEYFGIPFSFILGWLVFNEAPFDKLFPGVLLIVSGGLLVLWRERQISKRADNVAPPD